jgi:thiosulfate dehydrogenase
MIGLRTGLALAFALAPLMGCSGAPEPKVVHGTAIDHGKALFSDPKASPSTLNAFSCATCHASEANAAMGRILTGAPLAGVTRRPTFWGGQENDLLRAINHCRYNFMDATAPWQADDEDAEAMYAYLASLPEEQTGAVPFTLVPAVADLPAGDAKVGERAFTEACASCHGAIHTGEGRISTRAPRLPDDTRKEHAEYSAKDQRVIFVEKIRHGGFFGYGGSMPPFSREAMSDAQLGSLLAYIGLY